MKVEQLIIQGTSLESFQNSLAEMMDRKLEAFADKYIPDRNLKAKEACEILDISFMTLKRWCDDGLINPIITGGDPRYSYRNIIKIKENGGKYGRKHD